MNDLNLRIQIQHDRYEQLYTNPSQMLATVRSVRRVVFILSPWPGGGGG